MIIPATINIAAIITYAGHLIPNFVGRRKHIIIPLIKNNDEIPNIFKSIIISLIFTLDIIISLPS